MPSKDGPMNLRQKGMGGGRGSGAASGGGSRRSPRRIAREQKRDRVLQRIKGQNYEENPWPRPAISRAQKRARIRQQRKVQNSGYHPSLRPRPVRTGEKLNLVSGVTRNKMAKDFVKSAKDPGLLGKVPRSISPRMSKAPVKPSKSVAKRQAKFK